MTKTIKLTSNLSSNGTKSPIFEEQEKIYGLINTQQDNNISLALQILSSYDWADLEAFFMYLASVVVNLAEKHPCIQPWDLKVRLSDDFKIGITLGGNCEFKFYRYREKPITGFKINSLDETNTFSVTKKFRVELDILEFIQAAAINL